MLLPLDAVLKLPPEQRVLVVTGSQGEASAALARIAADEHQKIHIGARDVVMISATPVPGNEETVSETIDNLFRRGATVVFSGTEGRVRVSGHAARDELKKMLELVRPVHAVPIHGEYRHMALYRDLAKSTGIPDERILMTEIGSIVDFEGGKGRCAAELRLDRFSSIALATFSPGDPAANARRPDRRTGW